MRALAVVLAVATTLVLANVKGGGLILGLPAGMIVWFGVMEGRKWRRTGKVRRILYYLIVWVPISLSGRANIIDGIRDGWTVGDWLFTLLLWGVPCVLWVRLCAGVADRVARRAVRVENAEEGPIHWRPLALRSRTMMGRAEEGPIQEMAPAGAAIQDDDGPVRCIHEQVYDLCEDCRNFRLKAGSLPEQKSPPTVAATQATVSEMSSTVRCIHGHVYDLCDDCRGFWTPSGDRL